ncbi:MAG TPA: site-2 protease family protein [Candidatus Peribacterales bacterium]|nr:site-2 protease family protein [Candidatus Peribacterales bacterium]
MTFLTPPFVIAMLTALTIHECSHGLVAWWLGDPTARNEGRLTLNPLAHLDLMGTVMFLFVGFGWAKPVPVDPRYSAHPKRFTTLTALAGPLSNLLLAITTVLVAKLVIYFHIDAGVANAFFVELFADMLSLNLGLMAFNLLPIAPLDGSKILTMFIPARLELQYEDFLSKGPTILLFLLLGEWILNLPILVGWITIIVHPVLLALEKLL